MRGDQLSRQWRLLQLLAQSRGGVGPDASAAELECDRRTFYRDINALQYAGFPIYNEKRDGRVYYKLIESYKLGHPPFTPDELLALAFGEDLLRGLAGTPFHDSIESALGKIHAGLGPELRHFLKNQLTEVFQAEPGPHKRYTEMRDVMPILLQAVLERRTLQMRYQSLSSGQTTTRELDPYRVWYRNGALYLIGHDHTHQALRTFAVERIRKPKLSERRFEIPADFDFEAHTAGAFGVMTLPPEQVRVRFAARRAPYLQERIWHPSQRFEAGPKGSVVLCMEVGPGEELRQWLLSFGADALVLEPEALRRSLRGELDRARSAYG